MSRNMNTLSTLEAELSVIEAMPPSIAKTEALEYLYPLMAEVHDRIDGEILTVRMTYRVSRKVINRQR